MLIITTGGASSSPAPPLDPPKPSEEIFAPINESVAENQKEEPETVVAPLESAPEESGVATEEPLAEATAPVAEVEPLVETSVEENVVTPEPVESIQVMIFHSRLLIIFFKMNINYCHRKR